MEDEFATLLENLGYRVLRKRDQKTGIDIIGYFHGKPIPTLKHECTLSSPIFSPPEKTAFSLKRGDFQNSDVTELLKKIEDAKEFEDEVYDDLSGAVIVTNYSKTEEKIDEILERNVFCWDIRRLIFYSVKTRSCRILDRGGPIYEYSFVDRIKGSYIQETDRRINGMLLLNSHIFIDDHSKELTIGYDETLYMLQAMYDISLQQIIETTHLDVQTGIQFHILGLADKDAVINAYLDFSSEQDTHPKMQILPRPKIYEYGAAPWMAIYS